MGGKPKGAFATQVFGALNAGVLPAFGLALHGSNYPRKGRRPPTLTYSFPPATTSPQLISSLFFFHLFLALKTGRRLPFCQGRAFDIDGHGGRSR